MEVFKFGDGKWELLKKILLNQVASATQFTAQLTQIFDRLYQLNQTVAPSLSFNSLADVVVPAAGTAVRLPKSGGGSSGGSGRFRF